MTTLSGDESPMPPTSTSHRNGDHSLLNGGIGSNSVSSGQLTSELRNLVSIFGRQSENGISLEQLLTGSSPNRSSVVTPTQTLSHPFPTTPSSSKSTGWPARKRGRPFEVEESSKRRRSGSFSARQSTEKGHGKGLRHFSQRVCEKVRQKGNTTYNEVADELVKELSESERKSHGSNDTIDHKNIRRRVYDALNVLMAMNIISKEKKDIKWIGLPTNSVQECQHIEEELAQTEERILNKRGKVEELIVQILSYKNLMKRNRDRVSSLGTPAQNSAIGLPFIIVNTNKSTTIDCSISSDKSEYVFSFDNAFELHNDIDVLKKMGLDCGLHSGTCSVDNLKQAKSLLPKAFGDVLDEIALSKSVAAVVDALPLTPTAAPSSSIHSTPSMTLSPGLTPFTTPTASPHPANLAAFLTRASSSLQLSPQSGSPVSGGGYPSPVHSSPVMTSSTPIANLGHTPTALGGKHILSIAAKQPVQLSPVSAAKALLHQRCPSNQPGSSPLTKSSMASAAQSSPVQGSPSSLVTSKSPSAKIVTVSILQQLQQNPNISKLLSAASALQSKGNHQQNGNGSSV